MAILNYPRHFVLLAGGTAVLAFGLVAQGPWAPVPDRLFVLFGLSGALHAVAVVLALEQSAPWMARLGFVMAAAALSIAAALGGLGLAGLLWLNLPATMFLALAVAAALGAVWYWLLVRRLWAPFLSGWSLLATTGACVGATLLAALASGVIGVPRDPLLPTLWWLAFSISLYIADRPPRKP